jgi:hypothetical protein
MTDPKLIPQFHLHFVVALGVWDKTKKNFTPERHQHNNR